MTSFKLFIEGRFASEFGTLWDAERAAQPNIDEGRNATIEYTPVGNPYLLDKVQYHFDHVSRVWIEGK